MLLTTAILTQNSAIYMYCEIFIELGSKKLANLFADNWQTIPKIVITANSSSY
jgi:hypothetical protein